jgi:tRNA threonylcarbamoyladenosine biosynthesis protein TsaB
MITLAVDASTYQGTVAVIDGTTVLEERTVAMRGEHEERLMPAVAECLGASAARVDQVVCGEGPGSFTSLRIAGAIAKGLAESLGRPLVAAPSLVLIVAGVRGLTTGRYLAALDAMRGESYIARIDVDGEGRLRADEVERVPTAELRAVAGERTLIGPGLAVDAHPHARGVARHVGTDLLRAVALDGWEPRYGRLAEAQVKWEALHERPLMPPGA